MSDPLVVVDLFCGAGGFSTGAALAVEEIGLEPGEDVELHAINHWGVAIETHEANHPWATHYHSSIDDVDPLAIAEPRDVDLMVGGPECTHFSNARGGKPVSDQKREPAFNVLTWVQKLRPENVLIENVKEFRKWGRIEDGEPTRDGKIFDIWMNALNALGYSVDDRVLNAADYGDPTTRERLFIVARRNDSPTYPERTHSGDPNDDLPDWRPAADIIDWSDPGTSLWTRDLEHARKQPLSGNTMERIAEGIRRHCDDRLEPFADALEGIDPDELRRLRENIVPAAHAGLVAETLDEPFLVEAPARADLEGSYVLSQHSWPVPRSTDEPVFTLMARGAPRKIGTEAFCLRQQSGGVPSHTGSPIPTVSTRGAISLTEVSQSPLIMPKNGIHGGLHSNDLYPTGDRPFHTVTADPRAKMVSPALIRYSHGGAVLDVDEPMPTIATERAGCIAISSPFLTRNFGKRPEQSPRIRSLARPVPTVTATGSPPCLASPYLVQYYDRSDAHQSVDRPLLTVRTENTFGIATPYLVQYNGNSAAVRIVDPLPTATAKDRFALCVPEAWPWGLDVKYRMLKPSELKQAQGFPPDYEISGDRKQDVTEQIGNAVPVNTAKALCHHLLSSSSAHLTTFGGGIPAGRDGEVPTYEEVAHADD